MNGLLRFSATHRKVVRARARAARNRRMPVTIRVPVDRWSPGLSHDLNRAGFPNRIKAIEDFGRLAVVEFSLRANDPLPEWFDNLADKSGLPVITY